MLLVRLKEVILSIQNIEYIPSFLVARNEAYSYEFREKGVLDLDSNHEIYTSFSFERKI